MSSKQSVPNASIPSLEHFIEQHKGDIKTAKIEWYKARGITLDEEAVDENLPNPESEMPLEELLKLPGNEEIRLHDLTWE